MPDKKVADILNKGYIFPGSPWTCISFNSCNVNRGFPLTAACVQVSETDPYFRRFSIVILTVEVHLESGSVLIHCKSCCLNESSAKSFFMIRIDSAVEIPLDVYSLWMSWSHNKQIHSVAPDCRRRTQSECLFQRVKFCQVNHNGASDSR